MVDCQLDNMYADSSSRPAERGQGEEPVGGQETLDLSYGKTSERVSEYAPDFARSSCKAPSLKTESSHWLGPEKQEATWSDAIRLPKLGELLRPGSNIRGPLSSLRVSIA